MKKLVIASAVASALLAGAAVADTTVYGRANAVMQLKDNANGIVNNGSRIGFKGTEDLGNGMSALYHFEMGYDLDENDGAATSTRIGLVGLTGDFGTVLLGHTWAPVYTLVTSAYDPFNWFGHKATAKAGMSGRHGNVAAYDNTFGDVHLQVAILSDDTTDEIQDGLNFAINVPVGPVALGVGIHNDEASGESATAVSVAYDGGSFDAYLGYEASEDLAVVGGDNILSVGANFGVGSGTFMARISQYDNADASVATVGYTHNLSKRTSAYVEFENEDNGKGGDSSVIGLKHNF